MKTSEYTPAAWGIVAGLYTFLICMLAMTLSCVTMSPTKGLRPLDARDRYAVRTVLECSWNGWHAEMAGSGTIIGERAVLTAQHCATCPFVNGVRGKLESLKVIDHRGSIRDAVVTKAWFGRDIARLGVVMAWDGVEPPLVLPVRDEPIVTSFSSPMRGMAFGRASGARTASACPKPHSVFCHDFAMHVNVQRGNSGGGVYDAQGALVGVITGGFFPDDAITSDDGLASSLWPIRDEIFR